MASTSAEVVEGLSLEEAPANEALASEAPADGRPVGLLGHLQAAWATYQSENKRGWAKLVKEQADDPTLD